MADPNLTWKDVHRILVNAGLALKPKGKGLAIYSIDNPELPPVKASSVHPDLTLGCLEKDLGLFQPWKMWVPILKITLRQRLMPLCMNSGMSQHCMRVI